LPAAVHRDLVAYAELLGRITGQPVTPPAKLIVPMVERFMATDESAYAKNERAVVTIRWPLKLLFLLPFFILSPTKHP
jgi:hypothetical protein